MIHSNANELQKIKSNHPQRIIAESKLSKLFDVSVEAESAVSGKLRFINGSARTLQKVENLKGTTNQAPQLQAKGQSVLKFVKEIQQRTLERRIRCEEVQQRRAMLDQDKNASRICSIDKTVMVCGSDTIL